MDCIKDMLYKIDVDIICLQEHWLFNFEVNNLSDMFSNCHWIAKSVDDLNPIGPTQRPRGFGGVAIIWKDSINHMITKLDDGNERLVCIQIDVEPDPIILICIYMPCRGSKRADSEFNDILDQTRSIISKYSNCKPVICGDWNCDISSTDSSKKMTERHGMFRSFIAERNLNYKETDVTFIHPNGQEVSTIDYIFVCNDLCSHPLETERLDMLESNTSDHHPLITSVACHLTKVNKEKSYAFSKNSRIRWDKIDLEKYQEEITCKIEELEIRNSTLTVEDLTTVINTVQKSFIRISKPSKQKNVKIWNDQIAIALTNNKKALYEWKNEGKPKTGQTAELRKGTRKELRRTRRQEIARQRDEKYEEIMNAQVNDSKLFYKLVNSQRKHGRSRIANIEVDGQACDTTSDILKGWNSHFSKLATPSIHSRDEYTDREADLDIIIEICSKETTAVLFTSCEVQEAINKLHMKKAPDIYGLTAEHFKYGGWDLLSALTKIINSICAARIVPDYIKMGILTPIFKNKGLPTDPKNYRGITVLPVIGKILEILLKQQLWKIVEGLQSKFQRGFTSNVSPLFCALLLNEVIIDSVARKTPLYIALLDAKSAFDVVNHASLYRKLFLAGVTGTLWLLVHDLSIGAQTSVKWENLISDPFDIKQGVRLGGILSTDLYKLYINDVLDQVDESLLGAYIGHTHCAIPTCADDVSLLTNDPTSMQTLITTVENYSQQEKYLLQPAKCKVLKSGKQKVQDGNEFILNDTSIDNADTAVHLGITHNCNHRKTIPDHIQENISKARRTMYSLMGTGLHGKNGLNPTTALTLFQIYVLPVLIYGLEILLPDSKQLEPVEVFYRKSIKQILSIPSNTADVAIYILSGTTPVAGRIHKLALGVFASICRLEGSLEKEIAERQLLMAGEIKDSWFTKIRAILIKYNLPMAQTLLDHPSTKFKWKSQVRKKIEKYWIDHIISLVTHYKSISSISCTSFKQLDIHPVLKSVQTSVKDTQRLPIKLRLLTGTYIFQSTRAAFNQTDINPLCMLCMEANETLDHFTLSCKALKEAREYHWSELLVAIDKHAPCMKCKINAPLEINSQLVLDASALLCNCGCECGCTDFIYRIEYICRKLCFALHTRRSTLLTALPVNQKQGRNAITQSTAHRPK